MEELPIENGAKTDCFVDRLPISTLPVVRGNDCVINIPAEVLLAETGGNTDCCVDTLATDVPLLVDAETDGGIDRGRRLEI